MNFVTERRSIHGFVKVYEPPGTKEDDDNDEECDEYDFRHVAKETPHIANQNVGFSEYQQ